MKEANDSTMTTQKQALGQTPVAFVWTVYGEPASKANSRRVVNIGGMSRLIKSAKALTYAEAFKAQARPITPLLEGDLRVTMIIHYASRRPDLDESLILDLLQGVAYINDRQVKEKHIYWGLDKDNPRTEIIVDALPEILGKEKPRTGRGKKVSSTSEEKATSNIAPAS
jgi:Holliday junction resolvase RusA-like endonuclease